MLNPNPKERLTLHAVMKHPWINGESSGKEDYKKEMNTRVKKVMVKVRK
jgi:serine/threonine protein kinase